MENVPCHQDLQSLTQQLWLHAQGACAEEPSGTIFKGMHTGALVMSEVLDTVPAGFQRRGCDLRFQ